MALPHHGASRRIVGCRPRSLFPAISITAGYAGISACDRVGRDDFVEGYPLALDAPNMHAPNRGILAHTLREEGRAAAFSVGLLIGYIVIGAVRPAARWP
jgi:hypothetical protein